MTEHNRICACQKPRTVERCATLCERCRLPLTREAAAGCAHAHCWHPDYRNPRWGSQESGVDACKCCHCGETKDIAWRIAIVDGHGPYWRVKVKVFDE